MRPFDMPRWGYGAANLGNLFREMTDDAAWKILDAAWESGVRYFDTAPHYGLGLSERRLGAFLRTKPREQYVVSTKVGRLLRPNPDDDGGLDLANDFHVRTQTRREWDFSAEGITTSLDDSLERLGLDRVDILYLHDPERHDLDLALSQALPTLVTLRDTGRVDGVGVGSMASHALSASVDAAELDVIMVAGRYTLLEQPAAESVLPACHRTNTRVVAASVFNSGLLATNQPSRGDRYEYAGVPEDVWQRLQQITRICERYEVPLPAAALQFPLRNAAVSSVVVGASKPEQITRNLELGRREIPEDFWSELAHWGLVDGTSPDDEPPSTLY